jgi:hypothetical protein
VTKTDTISVKYAALTRIALSASSVTGGSSTVVTATVTLNGPAPAGETVVELASNKDAATVPSSVTVAKNATSAMVTATTTTVATMGVA